MIEIPRQNLNFSFVSCFSSSHVCVCALFYCCYCRNRKVLSFNFFKGNYFPSLSLQFLIFEPLCAQKISDLLQHSKILIDFYCMCVSTGGQFAEDGSFIGQYIPGKLNPPVSPQPIHHTQPGTSSGAATYV
jgi:hypothetical protein